MNSENLNSTADKKSAPKLNKKIQKGKIRRKLKWKKN